MSARLADTIIPSLTTSQVNEAVSSLHTHSNYDVMFLQILCCGVDVGENGQSLQNMCLHLIETCEFKTFCSHSIPTDNVNIKDYCFVQVLVTGVLQG